MPDAVSKPASSLSICPRVQSSSSLALSTTRPVSAGTGGSAATTRGSSRARSPSTNPRRRAVITARLVEVNGRNRRRLVVDGELRHLLVAGIEQPGPDTPREGGQLGVVSLHRRYVI